MSRSQVPKDPRGGHVRLYNDIVDSMAWRALPWGVQGLYIALRRHLTSANNGNVEATLSTLRHAGIGSSSVLSRGLRALVAVGLIAKTKDGGLSQGGRKPNLFRFTDVAVFEFPKQQIAAMKVTNEWSGFVTLRDARAAIDAAHKASLRPSTGQSAGSKNELFQFEKRAIKGPHQFEKRAMARLNGSKNEACETPTDQAAGRMEPSDPAAASIEKSKTRIARKTSPLCITTREVGEQSAPAAGVPVPEESTSSVAVAGLKRAKKTKQTGGRRSSKLKKASATRDGTIVRSIVAFVRSNGQPKRAAVVKHVSAYGSPSTIYSAISRLLASGRLIKAKAGVLTLATTKE